MAKVNAVLAIKVDRDWFRLVAYGLALKAIAELPEWDTRNAVMMARKILEDLPTEDPSSG